MDSLLAMRQNTSSRAEQRRHSAVLVFVDEARYESGSRQRCSDIVSDTVCRLLLDRLNGLTCKKKLTKHYKMNVWGSRELVFWQNPIQEEEKACARSKNVYFCKAPNGMLSQQKVPKWDDLGKNDLGAGCEPQHPDCKQLVDIVTRIHV